MPVVTATQSWMEILKKNLIHFYRIESGQQFCIFKRCFNNLYTFVLTCLVSTRNGCPIQRNGRVLSHFLNSFLSFFNIYSQATVHLYRQHKNFIVYSYYGFLDLQDKVLLLLSCLFDRCEIFKGLIASMGKSTTFQHHTHPMINFSTCIPVDVKYNKRRL